MSGELWARKFAQRGDKGIRLGMDISEWSPTSSGVFPSRSNVLSTVVTDDPVGAEHPRPDSRLQGDSGPALAGIYTPYVS